MTFKIVFAGTPVFACTILEALLNSTHTVLAVYTQPDKPAGRGRKPLASPTKVLALSHHLPVFEPSRLNNPAVIAPLKSLNPDLMVVAAYGLILPETLLSIPRLGCINVHASILPRFRGAAPIQYAILSGETETGITIMQMDKGMDTGDILSIYPCPIQERDTTQSLQNRLAELGGKALIETLDKLSEQGRSGTTIYPQKQDNTKASYAPKISKAEAKLNFKESAIVLDRKIRGFNPWPIAITRLGDQWIRIWEANVLDKTSDRTSDTTSEKISLTSKLLPGTIIKADKEGIEVATGEGVLQLRTLQFEGGKPLPVASILNARASFFEIGKQFDSFLNHE